MPNDARPSDELREACIAGDVAQIQRLFTAGRLNAGDASKALNDFVDEDDIPLLRCLLEHGADPQKVRITLVSSAKVVRLLVEFGCDIRSQGHLILHEFAGDRDTLDWLLDQGVDINRTNTRQLDGGFSLAWGTHDYSLKLLNIVAQRGDIELFDHLVARGADISQSLALHAATRCRNGSTAMLSHLLDQHKMDINSDTDDLRDLFHEEPDSGTPLCSAIYHKNLVAVKELLKRGADPERSGASGYHPVVKAVGCAFNDGFLPALEPLFEAGVDVAIATNVAVRQMSIEAAKICLRAGADPVSALQIAIEKQSFYEHEAASDPSEHIEAKKRSCEAMIALLKGWIQE